MNVDIQKLKALAEAATPGPWVKSGPGEVATADYVADGETMCDHISSGFGCGGSDPDDAAFVAAANPAAVLELIAQIERLERKNANQVESIREYQDLVMGGDVSLGMLKADLRVTTGERDELKAENETLRAEAAKWKNESVSDSQTIYSLSCKLAQRTGEVRELAGVVDDLSALTKRFVQRLRKAAPGNDLPEKALDYLKRKGLQGSAIREIVEGRLS